MLLILLASLLMPTPFADSLQQAYATQNVETARSLLETAETQEQVWMARYRLYPLTEEEDVLSPIPSGTEDVEEPTARKLALLAGLWAYKAGETNIFNAVRYGRRSMNFLEAAQKLDRDDPYVLLVEGQSLMFRPSIAGKDVPQAVERFQRLVEVLQGRDIDGIAVTEARTWLWLALKECGRRDEASALHEQLLADSPAPLYQQFLEDPPQV